jgi:lysophospholipase L1-like esterase
MKRWLKPSFLLAIALLCTAELIMHIFFQEDFSGRFEYGYNPTSGFDEGSDGIVHLVPAGGRHFLRQSFTKTHSPATFRIMVIGDSVTRGPSLKNAYPWLIGEQLRENGIQAECFNLGVPGYGAHRKFIVLQKALDYMPDLIILQVNDSNEHDDDRELKRSQDFKGWNSKNLMMKSLLLRRIYEAETEKLFWKWLPTVIRDQKSVNDADAKVAASLSPEKRIEWSARVLKYTMQSIALSLSKNVPILLIVQAEYQKGNPKLDDHNLEYLIGNTKRKGVYLLSMKRLFEPLDFDKLFSSGHHLYPAGHKIIAEAVVKMLQHGSLANIKTTAH